MQWIFLMNVQLRANKSADIWKKLNLWFSVNSEPVEKPLKDLIWTKVFLKFKDVDLGPTTEPWENTSWAITPTSALLHVLTLPHNSPHASWLQSESTWFSNCVPKLWSTEDIRTNGFKVEAKLFLRQGRVLAKQQEKGKVRVTHMQGNLLHSRIPAASDHRDSLQHRQQLGAAQPRESWTRNREENRLAGSTRKIHTHFQLMGEGTTQSWTAQGQMEWWSSGQCWACSKS